ncbi:MAG: hypothetical protein COA79_22905 [Planctomycetota bacterium]|nr:MAG: hypothetical protein COA79_22905 [Planctomycetota bacterium]
MKPLLNPLIITAFIVTMLLGSIAHLMYGSCQTSKYHYLMQRYWIPKYFHKIFYLNNYLQFPGERLILIEEEKIQGDKNDGEYKCYYQNGQLLRHDSYRNGELHGDQRVYHKNGQISLDEIYINGGRHGLRRLWYENGKIRLEENYKDDRLHGLKKSWYKNGQIRYEYSYINGKLHRQLKHWQEDGTLDYDDSGEEVTFPKR